MKNLLNMFTRCWQVCTLLELVRCKHCTPKHWRLSWCPVMAYSRSLRTNFSYHGHSVSGNPNPNPTAIYRRSSSTFGDLTVTGPDVRQSFSNGNWKMGRNSARCTKMFVFRHSGERTSCLICVPAVPRSTHADDQRIRPNLQPSNSGKLL